MYQMAYLNSLEMNLIRMFNSCTKFNAYFIELILIYENNQYKFSAFTHSV